MHLSRQPLRARTDSGARFASLRRTFDRSTARRLRPEPFGRSPGNAPRSPRRQGVLSRLEHAAKSEHAVLCTSSNQPAMLYPLLLNLQVSPYHKFLPTLYGGRQTPSASSGRNSPPFVSSRSRALVTGVETLWILAGRAEHTKPKRVRAPRKPFNQTRISKWRICTVRPKNLLGWVCPISGIPPYRANLGPLGQWEI